MTEPTSAPSGPPATPIPQDRPLWGLALSGGGIRSATFCFGVLVALARQRLLLRFALMSTVSGGGFIGALIGKLFHDAPRAEQVQEALADPDTRWFTWWLRANANYLFARGARDIYIAAATMLRNLIALHIELAVLALVTAALLASLNLLAWWGIDAWWWQPEEVPQALGLHRLPVWLPTSWLLLPAIVFVAGVTVCAYWALPERLDVPGLNRRVVGWVLTIGVLVALFLGRDFLLGREHLALPKGLYGAAWGLGLMWFFGIPLALWLRQQADFADDDAVEDRLRHRLTAWSAVAMRWGLIVAGVGALDRLAWFLAFEFEQLLQTGAALTLAALLLRTLLPRLGGSSGAAPGWLGQRLLGLAHVAGLALTLLLLAWWMALAYKQIFDVVFAVGNDGLRFGSGAAVAVVLGGGAAFFLVATGRNETFANLSSLHRYFKVRLVRGWLGATNADRMPATGAAPTGSVLDPRGPEPLGGYTLRAEVGDVHDGDDLPLRDYAPQHAGGPLHLVNTCLNHSVRSRQGQPRDGAPPPRSFNPARKGENLTVAPGGWMRVGTQPWRRLPNQADDLSLGAWTAISGAAFAPGLGAMTRSGIAALAMFAGVRLGWWWDTQPWQPDASGPRWFVKSSLLLAELLGRFQGAANRFWYLSDGGHFENTGVYALLRERTRLIVLADCGADPQYRFADIEQLVRLARVDLGTKIHFLKPDVTFADPLWRRFGSVGDLASPNSDACMALAEVVYPDEPGEGGKPGERGWLVLLKPNMFAGLPVDLINYRNANPAFPQQPTTDQGFDEPQWESYYALGREIGKQLDATLLERIANGEASPRLGRFKADDGRQLAVPVVGGKAGGGLRERLASGAVGASIGLTTAVTAGVSTWQVIDTWRASASKTAEADDKALKELTDKWATLKPMLVDSDAGTPAPAGQAVVAGAVAATLLRIGDTLCPSGFDHWFRAEPGREPSTAWIVLRDTRQACDALSPAESPSACTQLLAIRDKAHCLYSETGISERALGIAGRACPPRYWGRDYRIGNAVGNCERAATAAASSAPGAVATPVTERLGAGSVATAEPERLRMSVGRPASAASAASGTPTLPAAGPAASAPDAGALGPEGKACAGKTLYVQVYAKSRDKDDGALRSSFGAAGATVPRSEDISARARLGGRATPTPVRRDTLRFHTQDEQACALALAMWLQQRHDADPAPTQEPRMEPLNPNLKPTRGVVEVWLAPPADWRPR
jgi:hypothetical protein